MSSTVAAPRTRRQQLQQSERVDEAIMSAVVLKRRAMETVRTVLKALREFDEAINKFVAARDKEGEDG